MNQTEFMQMFFAESLASFARAGLADAIRYQPKNGGTAADCLAMIDRDVRDIGEDTAPLGWPRVLITLARGDIPHPATGDSVTLPATGERWQLEQRIGQDDITTQWVLRDA